MAAHPSLLVLLRHGESVMNPGEVMSGRYLNDAAVQAKIAGLNDLEIPLTARGWGQTLRAGELLRKRFGIFDIIIHSDMLRSIETATGVLAAYRNLHAPERRQMFLVNERNYGYTFAMTRRQSNRRYPWLEAYWEREGWFRTRPPGGESISDMMLTRTIPFLRQLEREAAGKRVLVCGHSRWIQSARIYLEGLPTNTKDYPVPSATNCGWVAYGSKTRPGKLELLDDSHFHFRTTGAP